jgi:hypothetical protein
VCINHTILVCVMPNKELGVRACVSPEGPESRPIEDNLGSEADNSNGGQDDVEEADERKVGDEVLICRRSDAADSSSDVLVGGDAWQAATGLRVSVGGNWEVLTGWKFVEEGGDGRCEKVSREEEIRIWDGDRRLGSICGSGSQDEIEGKGCSR